MGGAVVVHELEAFMSGQDLYRTQRYATNLPIHPVQIPQHEFAASEVGVPADARQQLMNGNHQRVLASPQPNGASPSVGGSLGAGCREKPLKFNVRPFPGACAIVANAITVLRIALVPLVVYLLVRGEREQALWLFALAGLSDALDGFVARNFNQRTRLGAILDPLADKLLIVATALALAWLGLLPGWLAAIMVGRDLVILAGALGYHFLIGPYEMAPSLPGKVCTFSQVVLVVGLLLHTAGYIDVSGYLRPAFLLVAVISVSSGAHYVWVWSRKAAKALT